VVDYTSVTIKFRMLCLRGFGHNKTLSLHTYGVCVFVCAHILHMSHGTILLM